MFSSSVIADAILAAADAGGIGVGIAIIEEGAARAIYMNDAALAILGRTREEVLGANGMDFLVPEEKDRFQHFNARRLRGEKYDGRMQTTITRPDGTRVPISLTESFIEIDGKPASVVFLSDMTERAEMLRTIAESEARFRRLAESAPDAIVISRQARVVYANLAAARILGHASPADMNDLPMSSFLAPDQMQIMRSRLALPNHGSLPPHPYEATRVDGTKVIVEIGSVPIEYDGAPAILAIGRDVTERTKMQAKLAHADRLVSIGTLAAGVAHEVNNPLTYMSLGLEALATHLDRAIPDETQRAHALEILREVRGGASRVARIVRDLKTFARRDEDVSAVDLREVLESSARMVARELHQRADVSFAIGAIPAVRGSVSKLEQVFVNLLINAAQAIEEDRKGRITIRANASEGRVVVEVIDDGRGVASADLPRLFDPFFTTKPPGVGTGLGLFVCLGIVRDFGGDIVVERLEKGTLFRVVLHAASELPLAHASDLPPDPASARASVLVIDDEPNVGAMIARLLEPEYDVAVVTSGEAALREIDLRHFDVLLCDLIMPGMTGMDLYEYIASQRPGYERSIVLMTGGAFTPRARTFLEDVPNTRLFKPFSLDTLKAAIAARVAEAE